MSNALGSRVNRSRATAGLALGDLLVLVGFLVAGELRHGVSPIESPLVVADTIAPFLLGWVVAALALGAYARDATASPRAAALRGAGAWVAASAIGLALRATALFHGDSPIAFALVVTGTGAVCFGAWRALAAALS